VQVDGVRSGKNLRIEMECMVQTMPGYEAYGCNIDTALPASIIAQMLLDKTIRTPGSFAPENIVPEKPFFAALKKYGMSVYENGRMLN
jgi:saccharopine dehydrogenase-like NADP-dependent oxidoreductase